MRIRQLRLLRYGRFTQRTLTLPASEHDIHLIVGPNEAGKSTVRHAISDWLFGFPERTPHAFLHPMAELRLGGVLESPGSVASLSAGMAASPAPAPARRKKKPSQASMSGTASLFGDDVSADQKAHEALVASMSDADKADAAEKSAASGAGNNDGEHNNGNNSTRTTNNTNTNTNNTNTNNTNTTTTNNNNNNNNNTISMLDFERTKGRKNTLRTADDEVLADSVLHAWLGNLQREAFVRTHALDHTTLVEGSEGMLRAADDIGRMLFQSAAGIEHLGEALKQLQQEADALWAPRKSGNRRYYRAADVFENARKDLAQARLRTKDWNSRREALESTERALQTAQRRHSSIQQDIHRLERIRRVQPLLLRLDAARQQLDELAANGMPPLLAEDARQTFRQASQDRILIEAEIRRLQGAIIQDEAALAAMPVDEALLREAESITRLNEHRLQCRDHPQNLLKHREEVRNLWAQVQRMARELGWPGDNENNEDAMRQRLPASPARALLHGLVREHDQCRQALNQAQTTRQASQRLIAQLQEGLKALADAPLDERLRLAVDRALKLGDYDDTLILLQQQQAESARKLENTLAGMGTWRQPANALAAMLVPDMGRVRDLIDQQRQDAGSLKNLQATLDATGAEIRQLDNTLRQLVRHHQPVSHQDVQQARDARNSLWQDIRQTPASLHAQADAFEASTRQADELADARMARAQHEAERQARQDQLERLQNETTALERQMAQLQHRMQTRLDDWRKHAQACGLPGLPLELAPEWLLQRQQALDLLEEKTSRGQQLQRLQESVASVQQTLCTLLNTADAEGATDLTGCVHEARARISRAEQAQGERKTLDAQLGQEQQNLIRLEAALEAASKTWQAWAQRWQQALAATGLDSATPVTQVEAQLRQFDEMETLLDRIRHLHQERIQPMQRDLDSLGDAARKLAGTLAPALAERTPDDIAQTLAGQLSDARRAADNAATLRQRLEQEKSALDASLQKQVAVQATLAPLLAAARVQDVEALGSVIDAASQRRQLEQARMDAEQQLIMNADGKTLDELRAECAGISPDALMAELDTLRTQATQAVNEIESLAAQKGRQKTDLDALDGNDVAARAMARQQEAVADMADAAEQWLQLQTAIRLLTWSIEKFRETRQGPLLERASGLFATLTRGSFSRLLVDTTDDTPRLSGIRPDGGQVQVPGMSEGSRDQLYLALRLAALDMQADAGQCLPLIADDLFINFDDQRTAAGLQVLGDMSRRMQVIFLTHHAHLVPLARQVLGSRLNVIALS